MITTEDFCILDKEEYRQEEQDFIIREKDKQEKFIMDLKIKLDNKYLFNLFCKKVKNSDKKNKNRDTDNSKLLYLSFTNFPDGVYLEICGDRLICHIIELKKNPKNKLDSIGKQFMSAKLHLISLFAIMDIDMSCVSFKYYVAYIRDEKTKVETYNEINPFYKKIVSGTSQDLPIRLKKWEESKIIAGVGKYTFEEEVSKVKMEFVENLNGYDMYYTEYNFI